MLAALDSADWEGKTILPFANADCTARGSATTFKGLTNSGATLDSVLSNGCHSLPGEASQRDVAVEPNVVGSVSRSNGASKLVRRAGSILVSRVASGCHPSPAGASTSEAPHVAFWSSRYILDMAESNVDVLSYVKSCSSKLQKSMLVDPNACLGRRAGTGTILRKADEPARRCAE